MFDALKNIGNLPGLMAKACDMQDKMKVIQEDLARRQVTANAGGGLVEATVNGQMQLLKIRIDKSRLTLADLESLESMVVSAVNGAQAKAAELARTEMAKAAEELGLPPGMLP